MCHFWALRNIFCLLAPPCLTSSPPPPPLRVPSFFSSSPSSSSANSREGLWRRARRGEMAAPPATTTALRRRRMRRPTPPSRFSEEHYLVVHCHGKTLHICCLWCSLSAFIFSQVLSQQLERGQNAPIRKRTSSLTLKHDIFPLTDFTLVQSDYFSSRPS